MSALIQKNPKLNTFFIGRPFSDELLSWVKDEDKIAKNIDVKYITDLAISLAMLYRFKDSTISILEKFGLKHKKDFIII